MDIKSIPLNSIKLARYNPRKDLKPGDADYEAIKRSIAEFGLVDPLVWNKRSGRLVGGHQRLKVLKASGVKQVQCVVVDLDDPHEKALNIALNRIGGEWDEPALQAVVADLTFAGVDIALTGFSPDDLELAAVHDVTEDDGGPDPSAVKPRCKRGEVWQLGEHRLMCGDATDLADMGRLMGDERAKLCSTDPPYGVDYTGDTRFDGGKDWRSSYAEVPAEQYPAFTRDWIRNVHSFLELRSMWYVWHGFKWLPVLVDALAEVKVCPRQHIVWVKPASVPGRSRYRWAHECCLLAWADGASNPPRIRYRNIPSTVWQLDYDGLKLRSADHPTSKPLELFAIPMRVETRKRDICIEPFCGSGSQIIAAEQLGRRCYAMEVQPIFCEVAMVRWESLSGKKAVKL